MDCFAHVDFADPEPVGEIGGAGFALDFDEVGDELTIVFRNFPAVILAGSVESFWVSDRCILTELSVSEKGLGLGLYKVLDILNGGDTRGCAEALAGKGCGGGGESEGLGNGCARVKLVEHSGAKAVPSSG